MTNYICVTCGTQYPSASDKPAHCRICEDDRQYVNVQGQMWTTLEDLRVRHKNVFRTIAPNLTGIRTEPQVAIGQQAHLIQTPNGNILWDCISYIDDPTIAAVRALGGITAIAICHPHFYSSMVEWAHAFNAPIHLHESNQEWVMHPDPAIQYWNTETCRLMDGITLIRCGGHFPGSTVLHWVSGVNGRGALFTGDTINVVQDQRYVSFMYSYPNLIPLPASAIKQIINAVEPFEYDRIYGGWLDKIVTQDAKANVKFSAERYIRAIES